jgi:NADH-quinone oxidoreductase subunit M
VAIFVLSALVIGGGLWPQPGVASRYHAATEIMARREVTPWHGTSEHAAQKADPDEHHRVLVSELLKPSGTKASD